MLLQPSNSQTVLSRGGWRLALILLTAGLVALSGALAQAIPDPLPGTVEPGRRDERPPPLERPAIDVERMLRLPPGAAPPPGAADQIVTIVDIRLDGVTAYRPEELRPLFESLLNEEITVRELYGIAGAIQARYQEDGYILSFALVPPQTVEDGIFTIAVVEGYVDKVVVEGIEGRLAETVQRALDPITRSRPLHSDDLERYLLLTKTLPVSGRPAFCGRPRVFTAHPSWSSSRSSIPSKVVCCWTIGGRNLPAPCKAAPRSCSTRCSGWANPLRP